MATNIKYISTDDLTADKIKGICHFNISKIMLNNVLLILHLGHFEMPT